MEANRVIKQQHDEVRALFQEVEGRKAGGGAELKGLFERIDKKLRIHDLIEENVYYPALQDRMRDQSLEFREEHHVATTLQDETEASAPGDAFYPARLKVLTELVEQHMREEEARFDQIDSILGNRDAEIARELRELTDRLQQKELSELKQLRSNEVRQLIGSR